MLTLRRLVCLAPLLWSTAAGAESPAQAFELRYRFQPGQVLAQRLRAEQELEVSSSLEPGVTHKLQSRIRVDTRQTVKAVGAEGAVIEVSFGQPEGEAISQGVSLPLAGLDDLAGLKLLLRRDERGQTSEVRPLHAPALSPEAKKLVAELTKNLTQNSVVFPERALRPGESWSEERVVPSELPGAEALKMVVQTTYTFRGLQAQRGPRRARIESQVLLGLKGRVIQAGVPVDADLQGRGQGVALFDLEAGRMESTTASLELGGSLKASQAQRSVETRLELKASLSLESP
jgi:hypothetical protein